MNNVSAIIVAAGNSTRMGKDKLMLEIMGKSVIERTISAFIQNDNICEIIVVTREDLIEKLDNIFKEKHTTIKPIKYVIGGNTRQQSVYNGVIECSKNTTHIAIHDGARPFISQSSIDDVINFCIKRGSATLAVPVKDTIKIVDNSTNQIQCTPKRELLWNIQTPQVFEKKLYLKAVESAEKDELNFTDDCQLIEHIGEKVYIVKGEYTNIKITTPEDISIGEAICRMERL